jgi:hypothetical protein
LKFDLNFLTVSDSGLVTEVNCGSLASIDILI